MADKRSQFWTRLAGRQQEQKRTDPLRVLTASATRLKMEDRAEVRKTRALRQGWQSDAWAYRDTIGELRYAVSFLANCASRMRLFAAAYPTGGEKESDTPIPLNEVAGFNETAVSAASAALQALGNGKLAVAQILESLSTNISVAGECFLLGQTDDLTGADVWTVRSIDEIIVADEKYKLREMPMAIGSGAAQGYVDLDPDRTVVSRVWIPHPRFQILADSPMRAILDDCESLLILRRMIRATGRSRLAGRGILFIPDEMSIQVPNDDNDDPQSDPFLDSLAEAMMEPISDEGVASAVVPIVVRGPGMMGDKIQHIDMASKFDDQSSKVRDELVGVIATGLDIPKEIISGMADLNHWTAWQIDDNTFRHHVEPHVVKCCDALTDGYLRPYLEASGIPPDLAKRVLFWYDPVELVTHPDQTQDAMELHDRLAISDEALRRMAGISEQDAPGSTEIEIRLLRQMRQWPPNLVMEFFHRLDGSLEVPAIQVGGQIPGIDSQGVVMPPPPPDGSASSIPAAPAATAPAPVAPSSPEAPAEGPPPVEPVVAAGARNVQSRLSQKLMALDRDLRSRLQTAACAAMFRQLERAGARLRTKVAKDETSRKRISHRPNEIVAALLGPEIIASAGLSAQELMGGDWSGLRKQFDEWTEATQAQAIATACRIAHLDSEDDAAVAAATAMASGREAAWVELENALTNLGHTLLYNPHPDDASLSIETLNQDTLVPTGMIRAALAIAGGSPPPALSVGDALTVAVGQIATGPTIVDLLTSAGAEKAGYEWVHGPASNPFEPHENLDGVEFAHFDDDVLQNTGDFPDNQYFLPGDHVGCTCDFMPLWLAPEEAA